MGQGRLETGPVFQTAWQAAAEEWMALKADQRLELKPVWRVVGQRLRVTAQ
jgi:hypothetical protein